MEPLMKDSQEKLGWNYKFALSFMANNQTPTLGLSTNRALFDAKRAY